METQIEPLSVEDYNEISQLYGYYARDVDPGSSRDASWMFTDDGVFNGSGGSLGGPIRISGRAELHEFYERIRREHAHGIRHFNTTYVIVGNAQEARSSGYMMTVERTAPGAPAIVADFGKYEDLLVKTSEGWRFKERIWESDTHREDTAVVAASPTSS
jgi:hypothetical protein